MAGNVVNLSIVARFGLLQRWIQTRSENRHLPYCKTALPNIMNKQTQLYIFMKSRPILIILLTGLIICTIAQKPAMILTFTADNYGQHVPLYSILIENLTQGSDTTIYAPDTVFVLDYLTGIEEVSVFNDNCFSLFHNYPNPIEDKTTIVIYLPESENVHVTVCDIMRRELIHQDYPLDRGIHSFIFYPGNESMYFLTAQVDNQSRTIKMLKSPGVTFDLGFCRLDYNYTKTGSGGYKAGTKFNDFVFDLGDQLQYTASSALGDQTIIDTPSGNYTYTFQYGSGGEPCPGMPTVTDLDGNVYTTVLIGTQCWMKENLKTTTYNNGTSIPNVTDATAWTDLLSGAYVWCNNDISWKESYGALYNWYATVDPNGLCPTGWHVLTNNEWTVLTDYIEGTGFPHGNELKSCRQVNSPLGGGCNTNEHPRWNSNSGNWGTDDYGFSGLPGGYRFLNGSFTTIGSSGYWWSSTETSSYNAWYYVLSYTFGYVYEGSASKQLGCSVRCLRD